MAFKTKERVKEYNQEYYIRNRRAILEQKKEYYAKNSTKIIKQHKKYNVKTNYKNYKTKSERLMAVIRSKTRKNFPLEGNYCKCGNPAEHRHHTTKPVIWNKFEFVCSKCHINLHSGIMEEDK